MTRSHFIKKILEARPIIDYLGSEGYNPVSNQKNRFNYLCTLHGPEKSPSFYVFTNDEFQYYH